MLSKYATRITLALAIMLSTISAFALAPNSLSYKTGVVEHVDLEKKLISIALEKTGEVKTYRFASNPKANINGKKTKDLSVISPGQTVTLKVRKIEKTSI